LRHWKQGPAIGDQISELSRSYFFGLALLAYGIFGSYHWAGFPFDNSCVTTEVISEEYIGTHNAITAGDEEVKITLSADNVNMKFCSQDMMRFSPIAFPALSRYQKEGEEYMTLEQERIVNLYGWLSIAILAVVAIIFLRRLVFNGLRNLFCHTYKPRGEATDIGFSEVREIFGYIPSIQVRGFQYPLLTCDVSGLKHTGLIGWKDPGVPYSEHNIIYDLPKADETLVTCEEEKSESAEGDCTKLFSIVKEWAD